MACSTLRRHVVLSIHSSPTRSLLVLHRQAVTTLACLHHACHRAAVQDALAGWLHQPDRLSLFNMDDAGSQCFASLLLTDPIYTFVPIYCDWRSFDTDGCQSLCLCLGLWPHEGLWPLYVCSWTCPLACFSILFLTACRPFSCSLAACSAQFTDG